tara:strand:- start:49536 stop:51560 length:2025 start_codon:yes stop_codon:yes gene_type:complete
MLVATVGCFWGGIASSRLILKKDSIVAFRVLKNVYLFGLPLFLFSFFTDCLTWDGIGFWILVPIPSILFGISVGRFYRKLTAPFPTLLTVFSLLFIALCVFLMEFFSLPQVYFFNHVWGAFPGPIYDETVRVTFSLFFFRVITFLWILLLWFLPDWKRSLVTKLVVLVSIGLLIPAYFSIAEFGVITPRSELKSVFTHYQSEHFNIYFPDNRFTEEEIEYWALKHEFHFDQIVETLEIDWPEDRKIESYLYTNAWQKKALVGAKFTSYVPIWLEQDQLHIAKEHLEAVLKHELVHVISKQFGNTLFNGSWSIGLIEGIAEGIAKDASSQSTLDQIMAADPPYPSADEMKSALSASGFYSSAGSISYTTTGSFVNYLLENYPVSNFKNAYPTSSFEKAYEIPFDSLVAGWHRSLPAVELDSIDQQVSNFIFSQRSIFQKNCPHMVSPIMELWDQVRLYETYPSKNRALPIVEQLYEMAPENITIKQKWAQYQLEFGKYDRVINGITENDSIPNTSILKADAFALNKDWEQAYHQLEHVWNSLPANLPRSFKYSFMLRKDTLQWNSFNSIRYNNSALTSDSFTEMNLPNQMLALQSGIEFELNPNLVDYSLIASAQSKNQDWFDIYELLIDRLIFLEEFDLAQSWIDHVSEIELRPRYLERLQEQKEWLEFLLVGS